MKRSREDYTVEINRLSELLEKLAPDAILTVLANLRPDELHALSKLPNLGLVRNLLNDLRTFKDLYNMRKAEKVRSKVSYAEEDLVNFLGGDLNYWHVFLCAYNSTMGAHFPTLVNKNDTLKILLSGEALDYDYAYEVDARMFSATELHPMFSTSGQAYRKMIGLVLYSLVDVLIGKEVLIHDIIYQDWSRIYGIRFGNLNVETFQNALTLRNPKFVPKQMLEYELLYDTYTVLAPTSNVMNNVAQGMAGIQRAKNIVRIFRKFFAAVYSYLLLNAGPDIFLETTNLSLMRPKITGIRQQCLSCDNSAVYRDTEARYFCSQECQKMFY